MMPVALDCRTRLAPALAYLSALCRERGRLRSVAGGGGAHGFSMAHLPLRLKLSNDVLHLSFGLGAVVSSLSPKLGELFSVPSLGVGRLDLSLTCVLGEPGANSQHRSLRTLYGGL